MYKIIGSDGKEYGPTTADEIQSWIRQGRLNRQSKVKPEDSTDWKTLSDLPEFSAALAAAASAPAIPAPIPPTTSGMAIASLVLGILGLFSLGLTAVVGLILGIIAFVKINRSQGRVQGLGLAIAGIAVSALMFLMLPVMAAIFLPALARAKTKAQTVQCMNHMKQLNLALIMYADDHSGTFPPADSWCDLIKPYTGGQTSVFQCPAQPQGRCAYALNAAIANKKTSEIGNPAQTVLIFSSGEGWNKAGGRELAVPHQHSSGRGLMIGFADGHVQSVTGSRAASLTW